MLSLALTLIVTLSLNDIKGEESTPQKKRRCLEMPFSSSSGLSKSSQTIGELPFAGPQPKTYLVFNFWLAFYVMAGWIASQYIEERGKATHSIRPKEAPEQKLWGKGCGGKKGPQAKERTRVSIHLLFLCDSLAICGCLAGWRAKAEIRVGAEMARVR